LDDLGIAGGGGSMTGTGRSLVLWAIRYMVVYLPIALAIILLKKSGAIENNDQRLLVVVPFHFVAMLLNFLALVVTLCDLIDRPFPETWHKWMWLILILFTGGIGWLVYVFRYGLKPLDRVTDHRPATR
jgi:hypothetical protein